VILTAMANDPEPEVFLGRNPVSRLEVILTELPVADGKATYHMSQSSISPGSDSDGKSARGRRAAKIVAIQYLAWK